MAGAPPVSNLQAVYSRQEVENQRLYRSEVLGQSFLQEVLITAPVRGLWDALDPASIGFLPQMAASLLNLRVGQELWQVRLGQALWQTLPGSGYANYLNNHYNNAGPYRVAARGGTFYYASGDGSFSAASGGTGLQHNPIIHGLDLFDAHYFLDGGSYLRKFDPTASTQVSIIQQPTTPGTVPSAKKAIWDRLVDWQGSDGAHPTGWDRTDNASIDGVIAAPGNNSTSTVSFPSDGGNDCVITYKSAGTKNKVFALNSKTAGYPGLRLRSQTIFFFFEQTAVPARVSIDVGINTPLDFPNPIGGAGSGLTANETSLFVVPTGNLPSINYLQFRVYKVPTANQKLTVSRIYLPGNLQGEYQWIQTNYDPSTGSESIPTDPSNGGVPLDLSTIGTNYQIASAAAVYKSAQLRLYPDMLYARRRVYRNGGSAPGLSLNQQGQTVWTLVAEVCNLSTTLNGSVTAGSPAGTPITLTAISTNVSGQDVLNLKSGDCIILDPGVVGTEEYVSIDDYLFIDLAVDSLSNVKVTSASRNFVAADVGNKITITGGSGWTPGTYNIDSISGTAAILHTSPAGTSSTGGQGTLGGVNVSTLSVLNRLPIVNNHSNGATVEVGLWDNTADDALDTTQTVDLIRGDCPTGAQFISKTADGRLVVANFSGRPTGVAFSNQPTPFRPKDFEVFPIGVNAETTLSPTQGFDFDLDGNSGGDAIVWMGEFQGVITCLTSKAVYRCFCSSQLDFGPLSVRKVLNRGCIAGETVQIVNGELTWVADGPDVVMWNGQNNGGERSISFQRISGHLQSAPQAYWPTWFARRVSKGSQTYYYLWTDPEAYFSFTDLVIASTTTHVLSNSYPFTTADIGRVLTITSGTGGWTAGTYTVTAISGTAAVLDRSAGTGGSLNGVAGLHAGCTQRFDYNATFDAWEPSSYNNGGGLAIPWVSGTVRNGPGDTFQVYQMHPTNGSIYQFEVPGQLTDAGSAIQVAYASKKYAPLHVISLERFCVRGDAFSDLLTCNLMIAGAENKVPAGNAPGIPPFVDDTIGANLQLSYPLSLAGVQEVERYQRVDFTWMQGHWFQFLMSGAMKDGSNWREVEVRFRPIRDGRLEE